MLCIPKNTGNSRSQRKGWEPQRDCIGRRFISLSPSSFLREPKQEAQDIVIAFVCKAKGTSQKQHLVLLINIFRGSYNMSDSYTKLHRQWRHTVILNVHMGLNDTRLPVVSCGIVEWNYQHVCACGGCNAHSLQMEIRNCMSKFPRFRAKLTKAGLFRHTRVINRQAEPV